MAISSAGTAHGGGGGGHPPRIADTTRLSYLVALGVGVWLLSSTSVLLGAQSVTGWVDSCAFIAATVILGRLFIMQGHSSLKARPFCFDLCKTLRR